MRITRPPFIVSLAVLLLGTSECDETEQRLQVARDQETRTKVSIAKQAELIQDLRDAAKDAQEKVTEAESVIVLCWDEPVIDLDQKQSCKAEAGGFFQVEKRNNGQIFGGYYPPENGSTDHKVYCQETKVAILESRFQTMSAHFERSCQLVWDEHERQRKIAEDKAAAEAAAWQNRMQPQQPATPAQQAPASTN